VHGHAPPAKVKIRVAERWPSAPSAWDTLTAIWSARHGVGSSPVSNGSAHAGDPSMVAAAQLAATAR